MITNSAWPARRNSALPKLGSPAVILRSFVLTSRKRSSQTYLGEFFLSYFAHLDGSGQTLPRRLIKPSATFSPARFFASNVDGALRAASRQWALRAFPVLCGTRPRTADVSIIAYRTTSGGTHERKKNESKNIIERNLRVCHELIRAAD
jgi:hypothetical protein